MESGRYTWLKERLAPRWVVRLRCLVRRLGTPRWGNLRRTRPFSTNWGFDRGSPIDRYYLDRFLAKHRSRITGRVLEIQKPVYTRIHGVDVTESHSVDVDPIHSPTHLCDLAQSAGVIESDRYDCFLMPHTLHVLRDLEGCMRNALRVVRPGGTILATACVFVPLVADVKRDGEDYWRLTAAGWREVTQRAWPGTTPIIETQGNCLASVAAMLGLAHEELTPAELDVADPRFPVVLTIAVQKPAP